MNFQVKTLETFNPFESLNHEQANTEQILDFRVIDFKLLCSSVKPAKTKTYERKDFDLFFCKKLQYHSAKISYRNLPKNPKFSFYSQT